MTTDELIRYVDEGKGDATLVEAVAIIRNLLSSQSTNFNRGFQQALELADEEMKKQQFRPQDKTIPHDQHVGVLNETRNRVKKLQPKGDQTQL